MPYEVAKLVDEYLKHNSWLIKENANTRQSFLHLQTYLLTRILMDSDIIIKTFGEEAWKLHKEGYIHIHKLPRSTIIPYCFGGSVKPIVKRGLRTTTIRMSAPKHLRSFLGQVMKLGYLIQAEFTGAIAHSMIDVYSAPYIRNDKAKFNDIKNAIETYIYTIETPIRLSSDGLFVNWTVYGDWNEDIRIDLYYAGKKVGESISEFKDEIIEFNKALIDVFLKGDADSRPFAFPIITVYVNDKFFESELGDKFIELACTRGSLYFLNAKYCPPTTTHAMCCRLIINHGEVIKDCSGYTRGLWAIPDNTGSIGVIGINLPRLAFEVKGDEDKVFDKLYEILVKGREILRTMRSIYHKSLYELGLMPHTYLNYVLDDNGEVNNNFFDTMFSTFAVFGIGEYVSIIANDPYFWRMESRNNIKQAIKIESRVIKHFFFGFPVRPDIMKKFIRYLYEKGLVYWSITPTLTVCLNCKQYFIGAYDTCPNCGSDRIEVWSRIIGYYASLLQWNPGRIAEFKERIMLGSDDLLFT